MKKKYPPKIIPLNSIGAFTFSVFFFIFQVSRCLAISNPAATYCNVMGYQYTIEYDALGAAVGICSFPDKSSASGWDFYRGKAGKKFSYCAKHGYLMETDLTSKEGYEKEIPVCVSKNVSKNKQSAQQRIPMLEMLRQAGKMPLPQKRALPVRSTTLKKESQKNTTKTYSTSLDWREYNGHAYIGPVRDQGMCGACYAFGAAAAAEGTYNVVWKKYDAQCVDFSEAYIAWCLGKYGPYSDHFSGCDGADFNYAELTALTREGITYEANFPYTETDPGSCTHQNDPVVTFNQWGRIDPNNDTEIQRAISSYGVIAVAVNVTDEFGNYAGGIFSDSQTDCPDGAYTTTNHAVALVGWGTDPTTGLYWILRNSWGSSWGENGYMRIQAHSARVACEAAYLSATSSGAIIPIVNFLLNGK